MSSTDLEQEVDLLYPEPQTRVALNTLARALPFAFSAGDTGDLFERVLTQASMGASDFDEDCFAGDLFIDELVERCLKLELGGNQLKPSRTYLRKALCQPPTQPSVTHYRQQIFKELCASPKHHQQLKQVYLELDRLRGLLSGGRGLQLDLSQRRLDILKSLEQLLRRMGRAFSDAESGLKSIASFADSVTHLPAFREIEELLSYEDDVARLDVRLRVGIDGRTRGLELLEIRENEDNAFHTGWLGRWWSKLVLLARGIRISEREILMRLTDHIFDALKAKVVQLFQLQGDIEFYLSGLCFADRCSKKGLELCLAEFTKTADEGPQLKGLFNPFLAVDGVAVQPCTVAAPSGNTLTIVTGPNSGGKTRLLQAIALSQLMGQSGLFVPAERARLAWSHGMFASIIEDVGAEQKEGRLGMELMRVRRLFERVAPGDLVILDELCSGTNPSEGAEIFRLVIGLLGELQPQLWLTTHFLQLAEDIRQQAPAELEFLQVELDAEDRPTYQFVPGVARTSLARLTAARLGVTKQELESLVVEARKRRRPDV